MKRIRDLAIGVVVGGLVGGGVAMAGDGFETGRGLMLSGRPFREGYAAGAFDMLDVVVSTNSKVANPSRTARWFEGQLTCMRAHEGGHSFLFFHPDEGGWYDAGVRKFTRWAEGFWSGSDGQAASLLLDNACK